MKHDKFDARNYNRKKKRFCKVCQRQSRKGSKYCSDQCEDKYKQQIPREYYFTSPVIDTNPNTASTTTSGY